MIDFDNQDNAGRPSEARQLELTDPGAYGMAFADVYDQWYEGISATNGGLDALVDFVDKRSPSRTVVELGVGSGRLAKPLADRGLIVFGVDASLEMLRHCPPPVIRLAADIGTLPFRSMPRSGSGPTILCGFNTLFNLHSQDRLLRLLTSLAESKVTFIVEMLNASLLADSPRQSTGPSALASKHGDVIVSSTAVDHDRQLLAGRHLEISDHGIVSRPWLLRWITVDELDTLAKAVGFDCRERYSTWTGEPFDQLSESAITVYRPTSTTATAT